MKMLDINSQADIVVGHEFIQAKRPTDQPADRPSDRATNPTSKPNSIIIINNDSVYWMLSVQWSSGKHSTGALGTFQCPQLCKAEMDVLGSLARGPEFRAQLHRFPDGDLGPVTELLCASVFLTIKWPQ